MGSDFCWGISSEVKKPGVKTATRTTNVQLDAKKPLHVVSCSYFVPLTSSGYPGKKH